jgi:hypothetical protein
MVTSEDRKNASERSGRELMQIMQSIGYVTANELVSKRCVSLEVTGENKSRPGSDKPRSNKLFREIRRKSINHLDDEEER